MHIWRLNGLPNKYNEGAEQKFCYPCAPPRNV